MSRRNADPFMAVPGMHPLEVLSLYNGDGYDDPEVVLAKRKAYATRIRRAAGQKPVEPSLLAAHNPPCQGCAFEQTCKARELACNIFAEWTVSRREIPEGIIKLLPSKKWMKLLGDTEHLGPIRDAYYAALAKKEGASEPKTDDLFFDQR